MILAVDIGNSTVAAAVFGAGIPTARWTVPTWGTAPAAALATWFASLPANPDRAVLASVVPEVASAWRTALTGRVGLVEEVGQELALPLELDYDTPETLGVDRVLSAAAGAARHGAPVIVASCGTATTVDVVDQGRRFRGGAILAGLGMQRDALSRRAAQLPAVPLDPPLTAVGRSTATCLQSGLLLGHAAAIDGLAGRFRRELDLPGAPLIGTGGLADVLQRAEPGLFTAVWNDLVLEGLALAAGCGVEEVR